MDNILNYQERKNEVMLEMWRVEIQSQSLNFGKLLWYFWFIFKKRGTNFYKNIILKPVHYLKKKYMNEHLSLDA